MLRHWFMRLKFTRRLREKRGAPLATYIPLWASSDALYAGPVGYGARVYPEARALEKVSTDTTISDEELFSFLAHKDILVAMYCFEALSQRRSPLVWSIPDSIRKRPEQFTYRLGCFVSEPTVDRFVESRTLKKEA